MTDTVISSARQAVVIGERINPTGRKLLAECMEWIRSNRPPSSEGRGRRRRRAVQG